MQNSFDSICSTLIKNANNPKKVVEIINDYVHELQKEVLGVNSEEEDETININEARNYDELSESLLLILFQNDSRARAAVFRLIRWIIDESLVESITKHRIDHFIARALMVDWDETEHIEALKLTTKWHMNCSSWQPPSESILRTIISLVSSQTYQHTFDKVHIQLLCLIMINHPITAIKMNIIPVLIDRIYKNLSEKIVLTAILPAITFGLSKVPLGLFPEVNLMAQLFSPVLEHIYPNHIKQSSMRGVSKTRKEVEAICVEALKFCFGSWACRFYMDYVGISVINTICGALSCSITKDEDFTLRCLYAIFGFEYPVGCKTMHEILRDQKEKYLRKFNQSLTNSSTSGNCGFLAGLKYDKFKKFSRKRPKLNVCDQSFLCLMFLKNGLIEACIDLILDGPYELFVAVNYLLAEFMHSCISLLPHELNVILLPKLISHGMMNESGLRRERATKFVSNINVLFEYRASETHCIYVDTLKSRMFPKQKNNVNQKANFNSFKKSAPSLTVRLSNDPEALDKFTSQASKTCLSLKDPLKWNWKAILDLLITCQREKNVKTTQLELFSKMLGFYRVQADNSFHSLRLNDPLADICTECGLRLIDLFIRVDYKDFYERLKVFIKEIEAELRKVLSDYKSGKSDTRNVFSTLKLTGFCSQYYFLFIGELSASKKGCLLLHSIYDILIEMISIAEARPHLILALTSFEYSIGSKASQAKYIFEQAIRSPDFVLREYSTSMLRIIVRLHPNTFDQWALHLLVQTLGDPDPTISEVALDVFDEACQIERICRAVSDGFSVGQFMKNSRTKLGLIRVFSVEDLFLKYKAQGVVQRVLDDWESNVGRDYVEFMDNRIAGHDKRNSIVLPHLFGEMSKHRAGLSLIKNNTYFLRAIEQIINYQNFANDAILKEYLWMVGNVAASSKQGIELILQMDVIPSIMEMSENSTSIAVRMTCFYVNNLISVTYEGGRSMKHYGWSFCIRTEETFSPIFTDFLKDVHHNIFASAKIINDEQGESVMDVLGQRALSFGQTYFPSDFSSKKPIRTGTSDSGFESPVSFKELRIPVFGIEEKMRRNPSLGTLKLVNRTMQKRSPSRYKSENLPTDQPRWLTLNRLAKYNEYREIVGLYSFGVFNFLKGTGNEDDESDHEDQFKTTSNIELLIGICLPVPYDIILKHPSHQTNYRILNSVGTQNTTEFEGKSEYNHRLVVTMANYLLTGTYRKKFENMLLKHKHSSPETYRNAGLFLEICSLIAKIKDNLRQKEILYELFIELDISEVSHE